MSNVTTADWNGLSQLAIKEIIEWAKGAKEFVSEQSPELVQEILRWGFWSSTIVAIICAILVPVLLVAACKIGKDCLDRKNPTALYGCIILSIGCLSCIISMFVNGYQAFYIALAPRVYLLGYLKNLMK